MQSLLILKSVNINNCNSSEYADLDYHLSLKCTVQVTDNGYPNPQSDTATAIITIDRDLNVPVFTSNARYAVTIDETTNIGSSILNVQASRLNLVVFTFIKDTPYGKLINLWIIIVCISILNFPGTYLLWINWRLSCPEFLHGTEHQWCHQCHPGSASRQPASELLLGEILTLAILFSS